MDNKDLENKIFEEGKKVDFEKLSKNREKNQERFHDNILEYVKQQGIAQGWFDPEKHILRLEKEGDTIRIILDKKVGGGN